MSLIDKYLCEAKGKYEIRKTGDGYSISGPLKDGQQYHDKKAKTVKNGGVDDGLWDSHAQAEKKVKQLGGILRTDSEMKKIYSK